MRFNLMLWLMLAALTLRGLPALADDTPAPPPQDYVFDAADALGDGKPLSVYLRAEAGEVTAAFALSPGFNRSWHKVDAGGLRITDGGLAGDLAVTVRPDPWVPKDGQPIAGVLTIDLDTQAERITGNYTATMGSAAVAGPVTGRRTDGPRADALSFELDLFEAVPAARVPNTKSLDKRLVTLRFVTEPRKAEAGTAIHRGGGTYGVWAGTIDQLQMLASDTALHGSMRMRFAPGKGGGDEPYAYELTAMVVADRVVGTHRRLDPGEAAASAPPHEADLLGRVTPVQIDPAHADYRFVISNALRGDQPIIIYASCTDGVFHHGFAVAPTVTRTPMRVDVSKLLLQDGRVIGTVTADTLDASDPDAEPALVSTLTLRSDPMPGGLMGEHSAISNRDGELEQARGVVNGSLAPPAQLPDGGLRLHMKFEDGLTGGEYWQNRAFIGLDIVDGNVTGGSLHTDHPIQSKWTGTFVAGDVALDGRTLKGSLEADIATTGPVKPGRYRFEYEAHAHAAGVFGEFRTYYDGKLIKRGRLIGSVAPAEGD